MLAIIDYGSGNLRSVAKAFERITDGGMQIQVTCTPDVVRQASHIVLPGVGAFKDCMAGLTALPAMLDTLQKEVLIHKKKFLGICVGMQMLFEKGHEHGTHSGLGWLKGEVVPLAPADTSLKVPHMGWNDLQVTGGHAVMEGLNYSAQAYFVHSYHAECKNAKDVLATTAYGQTIAAVVGQGNIVGTQFHPEKSQETGLALLKNFINWQS
jgi:imidazole glycerol-phosphate synthase subunit HisH